MTRSVTQLLLSVQEGRGSADEVLEPLVYDELRQLAGGFLSKERVGHTLQPTALVHEAYLALANADEIGWQGRTHFRAVAAKCMRRLLIDHARRRQADRRGAGAARVTLSTSSFDDSDRSLDVLELEDALEALAKLSPRAAQIVELSCFGGLTQREVGTALGISERTVRRELIPARAWLSRELGLSVAEDDSAS